MFTKCQFSEWNALLNSFHPLPDDEHHRYNSDFEKLLLFSVELDVFSTTFLVACEYLQRCNQIDLLKYYDKITIIVAIVFITCELKEVWVSKFKDLQNIVRNLHSDAQICKFDNTQFRKCVLKVLSYMNFNLFGYSLLEQFQQCAFSNTPACFYRLVDCYNDQHMHDKVILDADTCPYEHAKLWYDFAVFYGYWRSDYITLFIYFLTTNEVICHGCIVDFLDGDRREAIKIVCYGYKMMCHLRHEFPLEDILHERYRMPKLWKDDINVLFCNSCCKCESRTHVLECKSIACRERLPISSGRNHEPTIFEIPEYLHLKTGSYGNVYCCDSKRICFKNFNDNLFSKEICISLALNHKNILPMIDCGLSSDGFVWMSTAYCCRDLQSRLRQRKLNFPLARKIMLSIGEGLHYMHKHCFLHFDLKPSNILCSFDAEIVQLLDFSLTQRAKNSYQPQQHCFDPALICSIPYRAPELLFHYVDDLGPSAKIYVFAADCWALGAIYYQILQTDHLQLVHDQTTSQLDALAQIFRVQAKNVQLHTLNHYGDLPINLVRDNAMWQGILQNSNINAVDLIDSLLDLNPKTRKTTEFVLKHPFLTATTTTPETKL